MADTDFLGRHAAGLARGEQAGRDAVRELQQRLAASQAALEAANDPRFSTEHRATKRREILDAAAAGAMTYLRETDIVGALERLGETARLYSDPNILRRASFISIVDADRNETGENAAAMRWTIAASRMPTQLLVDGVGDAIADKRWAIVHTMRSELMQRAAGQVDGPVHDARVAVDMMVGDAIRPLTARASEIQLAASSMQREIGFLVNKLEGKTALSGTPLASAAAAAGPERSERAC